MFKINDMQTLILHETCSIALKTHRICFYVAVFKNRKQNSTYQKTQKNKVTFGRVWKLTFYYDLELIFSKITIFEYHIETAQTTSTQNNDDC